ncbi:branched-chain amino acid ABC transporter permease [Ramlibacter sp.]|uniref:branched-chain amino acid ABC transporter permease n=1 Tax=Ramlibacter sp. TaxID=1917967 RepID=UPI003D0CECD2
MIDYLLSYASVLDAILIGSLLAMSQFVVLRAGVFSLAPAAFAAVGAYTAALMVKNAGMHPALAVVAAMALGTLLSAIVALPLSRLRGVFQALATLALVQVVMSFTLTATPLTNGAIGINSIPRSLGTGWLLVLVAAVILLLHAICSHGIGRAFNVILQDETVAASLGVQVAKYHRIAFLLSGCIGGLAGAAIALSSYTIQPSLFGFHMLVNVLAMVVLGGTGSVWGPLIGAAILTLLPEMFRVFADYRTVVQGVLLCICIMFMPRGVTHSWRFRRAARPPAPTKLAEASRA